MSAGRFQLVCCATDERMPFPRGNPPPEVGHLSVEELRQFCDAEIGRAIDAWRARGLLDRNDPIDQAGPAEAAAVGSDA